MLNSIKISEIYVLDQDEALDFYVGKLGMEVHTDADLGFMRWLTVNVPGHPDRELLLVKPGPPAHDEQTAAQIRDLVSKGAMSVTSLTTEDARKTHATLRERGVDLTEEPTERDYGIDFGLRDPFGNPLRIGQVPPA